MGDVERLLSAVEVARRARLARALEQADPGSDPHALLEALDQAAKRAGLRVILHER